MPVFNEEFNLYDQNNNSELFHLHSFGKLFPIRAISFREKKTTTQSLNVCLTEQDILSTTAL